MVLLGSGIEVDVATGMPLDVEKERAAGPKKDRREQLRVKYNNLINDLCGTGGEILQHIIKMYVNRVNHLMNEDPICSEYQNILDSIGLDLEVGKKIVESRVEKFDDHGK